MCPVRNGTYVSGRSKQSIQSVIRESRIRTKSERNAASAQFRPKLKNSLRKHSDNVRRIGIRLLGSLGIDAKQDGGVMSATSGDDMHRHIPVQQYRLMTAAEIMEPKLRESELAGARLETA
jgi:hypothetical protein